MAARAPHVVLFDLDGTLVDSAPDLAATANAMRAEQGLAPLPYAALRAHAGSGARGMLGAGLGLKPGDEGYLAARDRFHDLYAGCMLEQARLFAGVAELLAALQAASRPWGIVTNKAARFSEPLCAALGIVPLSGALVSGDSTPHTKPHPAPLQAALQRLGASTAEAVYVGDDLRDMQAAQAAGLPGWAAAWGYLGAGADPAQWGAAAVLDSPAALLKALDLA